MREAQIQKGFGETTSYLTLHLIEYVRKAGTGASHVAIESLNSLDHHNQEANHGTH
jgi:hypothetical protein